MRLNNLLTVLVASFLFVTTGLTSIAAAQDVEPAKKAAEAEYMVGVGKCCITPTEPMWMAGYASRTSPWQEVLMDIWAKTCLIEDREGNQLLLISLDLVGVDHGLAEDICQKTASKHQLKRSQIVIATSHTHSGPVVGKNLRAMHFYQLPIEEQKKILDFSNALVGKIETAVDSAFSNRKPVELRWGFGSTSFATNRRNNPEADVPKLRAAGKLAGPIDHRVPVLGAFDASNNALAIIFGYACHSTVLSINKISGDYPGFAQAELERKYPGSMAMFWAGCGADVNPLPRRTEELAEFYGHQLAGAVQSVLLTQAMQPISGLLSHQFNRVPLKLDKLPSTEELRNQTESANKYEAMRAKLLLERIDAGQPLSPVYEYPIQTWQFANGPEWVHLGGEVVVDFALRIASERNDKPTWVTSYANDVMAYIPSERVLNEGGYEGATSMVYYGLPTLWAKGIEQTIMDEVHRQLDQ